jgi:hypothetical protein
MRDIVERLRSKGSIYSGTFIIDPLTAESADEIERLRQRVAELEAWHAAGYAGQLESRLAAAERERDEAVALLLVSRDCLYATSESPWADAVRSRIDAFLAKLEKRS